MLKHIKDLKSPTTLKGALLCLGVGGIVFFLGRHLGGSLKTNALAICLILGILIGNTTQIAEKLATGVKYTEKTLLQLSIILMGFKMSATDIIYGEWSPILIGAFTLILSFFLIHQVNQKFLKISTEDSHCISAGCSICGSSAIMAVEGIYNKIDKTKLSLLIALVGFLSTLSFFIWPLIFKANLLPFFSEKQFGIFMGASVFAVPQAIAGGGAVGEVAENYAALTKLTRVLCLVPLILFISHSFQKNQQQPSKGIALPHFVLWFIAILGLNALPLPAIIPQTGQVFSSFLMYGVMVAVGLKTVLHKIFTRDILKTTFVPVAIGFITVNLIALLLSSFLA